MDPHGAPNHSTPFWERFPQGHFVNVLLSGVGFGLGMAEIKGHGQPGQVLIWLFSVHMLTPLVFVYYWTALHYQIRANGLLDSVTVEFAAKFNSITLAGLDMFFLYFPIKLKELWTPFAMAFSVAELVAAIVLFFDRLFSLARRRNAAGSVQLTEIIVDAAENTNGNTDDRTAANTDAHNDSRDSSFPEPAGRNADDKAQDTDGQRQHPYAQC